MAGLVGRKMWSFTLYPEAGEGGGSLSVRRLVAPSGRPPNVVRAREEAARRARAKIRRYGAANRLNRLGTLTYRGEGCHDPARLRSDLAGSSASCARASAMRRSRMCGCRSGIRAGTVCTRISRLAALCRVV